MANKNFEFAQFPNFAAPTNFDELMRQFQTTQAHHEEAVKARDQARLEHQQWQEYMDLCTDYRDLFSAMMKKLLDAKTGTDIEKIRAVYGNKLVPVLQKIMVIQKKIQGQPTPAQIESRADVANKFERVKALLDQATKLKDEVIVPEPTSAV
jgi:hypothetical protein